MVKGQRYKRKKSVKNLILVAFPPHYVFDNKYNI